MFPAKIQKLLEQNGYFKLSKEERIKAHEKCLSELRKINIISHKAGMEALKQQ